MGLNYRKGGFVGLFAGLRERERGRVSVCWILSEDN